MTARTRITSEATIWYDPTASSDGDGSEVSPYNHLQVALDHASGDFDFQPPFSWINIGNYGKRAGVTIQMKPTTAANAERFTVPVFLDGHGQTCPITLRGDPSGRNGLNYNLYGANQYQALTTQGGGELTIDGVTLRGDANCTLINSLEDGTINVGNVFLGSGSSGLCNGVGAAGQSRINIFGAVTLIGAGFNAAFEGIEESILNFLPGAVVNIDNNMNFGVMITLAHAQAWTQGVPISWGGAGLSVASGYFAKGVWQSCLGFYSTSPMPSRYTSIPPDPTSIYL